VKSYIYGGADAARLPRLPRTPQTPKQRNAFRSTPVKQPTLVKHATPHMRAPAARCRSSAPPSRGSSRPSG
jgi:hypothetical protein